MTKNYSQIELANSVEVFKDTVPLMRSHSIPLTPENYAIWYTYSKGNIHPLNQAIKKNLEKGVEFSKQVNKALHREYIDNTDDSSERLDGIQEDTKELIEALLSELKTASGGSDDYLSSMEVCEKQLLDSPDVGQLTQIMGKVIEQTKQMNDKNRGLAQNLKTMESEVDSLKKGVEALTLEATTDQLTSLANRRGFEKAFAKLQHSYDESGVAFSLLLIDIDHFKQFNDTYGHAIGDRVLSYVGSTIKSQIEPDDIAARFGGEEFVIALHNVESKTAVEIANRIRAAISNRKLRSNKTNESLGSVTVSIGVATIGLGEDMDSLIDRADIAMYRAKANGRDQVCG